MKLKVFIVLLLGITFVTVQAIYVPNSRETSEPPEKVTYAILDNEQDGLVPLYEVGDLSFYYRESRDTIAIYDARNDYTWKTGTDLEFAKDIDDVCDDTLDDYEDQFTELDVSNFGFVTSINENLSSNTFFGENHVLKVSTTGLDDTYGSDDYTITYPGLNLVQGNTYQLSFDVSSLKARSIHLVLGTYLDEIVTTTTESQTLTFVFEMTDPTTSVDLNLEFGYIVGDVDYNTITYLDNLALETVTLDEVDPDSNQITRGDFELLESEYTVSDQDIIDACQPKEVRLNTTYTGFANSLLSIEYIDSSNTIKRTSSAAYEDVESTLYETNEDNHYILEIEFDEPEINIDLHIYFDAEGIRYQVRDEEITGDDQHSLAAIIISPFLGASGGAYEVFDINELDYADEEIFKYKIPGYTLVPDGSGSLIRFNDNTENLEDYNAQIYGTNIAQTEFYYGYTGGYVPFKTASLPVFGMSHGDDTQAAFVAFATQGDEYMQIVSMPEENLTYYNFTYPRFEYNLVYSQVYNKQGWGFYTPYEERNHFDIDMRYNFLAGDGTDGPSASYVGMAQSYRDYLIGEDILHEATYTYDDIPLRLDFLMSDVEEGITGYNNQVTTTVEGVDRILQDVRENNILNVNVGLLGWQDGGITLGDPWKTDFTREIGTEREFRDLIDQYQDLGIDISFSQDYYNINNEQMFLRRNATQHTSSWYAVRQSNTEPIAEFYFARPVKSVEWLLEQTRDLNDLNVASYTITGITSNLTSDYTLDDVLYRNEAQDVIVDGFDQLTEGVLVNADRPNAYLLGYVDRYLNAPVYGTQYLIETDTVPFVELVLQNTMELYGPYSNFSFYTDRDILRMVDYNIYPSFVLTEEPAYLLTDTMSKNFYSTEYYLYEELIGHVYEQVNGALGAVISSNWINRTVVENGLVVNEYDNGILIAINYSEDSMEYNGVTIEAESYRVIGG